MRTSATASCLSKRVRRWISIVESLLLRIPLPFGESSMFLPSRDGKQWTHVARVMSRLLLDLYLSNNHGYNCQRKD